MNYLKALGLCLTCIFVYANVSAQTSKIPLNEPDHNKPRLFKDLPDQIPVNIETINSLLNSKPENGRKVTIELAEKTLPGLSGEIISTTCKYNNTIRTLIIRPSNFSAATLTLSSFTNPDGAVSYTGRIISFQHGDAYVLEKRGEQYLLIKKDFHDLVNE